MSTLSFLGNKSLTLPIIQVYKKDEATIYQSPGDGHCVVHSAIRKMKDQGLKAIPNTNNFIDMVSFEILNNLNFFRASINAEVVHFGNFFII